MGVVENAADDVDKPRVGTYNCGNVARCSTELNDFTKGKNSSTVMLMDEHANVLPSQFYIWFSLLLDFEEALAMVTAIDDSKCDTDAQNETTTVLFYHVIY